MAYSIIPSSKPHKHVKPIENRLCYFGIVTLGATVTTGTTAGIAGTATTDVNGSYSLMNYTPALTYTLTASAPGYAARTATVTLTLGKTVREDFALDPLPPGTVPPGNIAGTVTNATSGAPIQGATVTAGAVTVTTDANGSFSMLNIAAGIYTVTASKAGFITNTTAGAVVNSGATTTLDIALQPGTAIKGDANENGVLDVGDGLFAMQAVAGLRTLTATQTTEAEVDGSGKVDVGDCVFILQAVAGLRTL